MAKRKPYRWVLYLAARAAALTIYLLPRAWALSLARFAGRMAYTLVGRQRGRALENLRFAFGSTMPERELRQTARAVFEHAAQTAAEILQFPKLNLAEVGRIVEMGEAYQRYESLLREGKGLISITAHIGNWELLAGVFALKGFSGAVVARRVYYEPYNRWIVALRRAVGVRTIYRNDSAREILALLKGNQIVGLLPDQDIDGLQGVFVDFFGRPAYTPVAPVKLALASGSPLLPNFLIREPRNCYRLVAGEVIRPVVERSRAEALQKYTAIWMQQFENVIREHPEQWVWMHPRWKTKPDPVRVGRELLLRTA